MLPLLIIIIIVLAVVAAVAAIWAVACFCFGVEMYAMGVVMVLCFILAIATIAAIVTGQFSYQDRIPELNENNETPSVLSENKT